jgi:hypothetical protein
MTSVRKRSLVERIARAPSVLRQHYRICRRYARRWDATCISLRLTWAHIDS